MTHCGPTCGLSHLPSILIGICSCSFNKKGPFFHCSKLAPLELSKVHLWTPTYFGYSYTKILKKIWRMSNRIIFSSDLLMMMCLLLGPTLTTSKHTWMQNNKEDIPIFRVNPRKPVFISQEMMVHFDDCKNVILLAEVFTICGRKSIFINLKW